MSNLKWLQKFLYLFIRSVYNIEKKMQNVSDIHVGYTKSDNGTFRLRKAI